MIRFGRALRPGVVGVGLVLASAVASDRAHAASLRRAKIMIDAREKEPAAAVELTLAADAGKPTSSVDLYLASAATIAEASLDGQKVSLTKADVPKTSLRKWTLGLPLALTPESSRTVALRLAFAPGSPGIQSNANGGTLLAGSGWFPSTSPTADALLPHSTGFTLAEGMRGVACGSAAGALWTSTAPGRPFAAWGAFTAAEETHRSTKLEVWSRAGAPAGAAALDQVASSWERLQIDYGARCGGGTLRVVDVGEGIVAGGQNTLLWDASRSSVSPEMPEAHLFGRDVAAALATSFWNDCIPFEGEDAGWLSRAVPEAMGDGAYVASLQSAQPEQIEAILGADRRDRFFAGRAKDSALRGLVPVSPEGPDLIRGRGAITVQMIAEAAPSQAMWNGLLEGVGAPEGPPLTGTAFFKALGSRAPNQHEFLEPFIVGTALPDFRISSHVFGMGPQKDRLRVEVENIGEVEAPVEVQIATAAGEPIRTSRLSVPPGDVRAILLKDEGRAASIRLDPRAHTLQSDVSNDEVKLAGSPSAASATPHIPSYPFQEKFSEASRVSAFAIQLDGVTISEFEGVIVPYATSQGPSGASLLGKGRVQIAPPAPHTEGWNQAMKRDTLGFQGSEMWIRFPLEKWPAIEAQLGQRIDPAERNAIVERNRPVYEHSFPTHYFEEMRAQVPPPGGSLVTFTSSGGELRGFTRIPHPDGKVTARFWDQLSGVTIWEETR